MSVNWYALGRFQLDCNLLPVVKLLRRGGVDAYVSESLGELVLWASIEFESELIDRFFAGEVALLDPQGLARKTSSAVEHRESMASLVSSQPITFALVIASIAGTILIAIDNENFSLVTGLTFTDFRVVQGGVFWSDLGSAMSGLQWWRLVSPVFLHFSFMHLLLNSLWLWVLGGCVERLQSSGMLLVLVVAGAVAGNFLQYQMVGPSVFGGMSGVVYALIGYIFLLQMADGFPDFGMPVELFVVFLCTLAVGFTGFFDNFMVGRVANGAHLGGLLAGVIVAAGFLLARKVQQTNNG